MQWIDVNDRMPSGSERNRMVIVRAICTESGEYCYAQALGDDECFYIFDIDGERQSPTSYRATHWALPDAIYEYGDDYCLADASLLDMD